MLSARGVDASLKAVGRQVLLVCTALPLPPSLLSAAPPPIAGATRDRDSD